MKNIIIVIIKLLLLLSISFKYYKVNGQSYVVLQESITEVYTSNDHCNYDDVYVVISGYQEFTNILIETPSAQYSILNSNGYSNLIHFSFQQIPIGTGLIEFKLNSSGGSIVGNLFVQLLCSNPNTDVVTISKVSELSNNYNQLYGGYIGIIKVQGLGLFTELSATTNNVLIKSIRSKTQVSTEQYYTVIFQSPPSDPLGNWECAIKLSPTSLKIIEFNSPIITSSNNKIQLNYLFDRYQLFQGSFQFARPTIQFNCNNSIQINPIFYIDSLMLPMIQYIPISGSYGSTNSITYLSSLVYNDSEVSIVDTLTIASQNYSNYIGSEINLSYKRYSERSSISIPSILINNDIVSLQVLISQMSYSPISISRFINGFTFKKIQLEYPFGYLVNVNDIQSNDFEATYSIVSQASSSVPIGFTIKYELKDFQVISPLGSIDISDSPLMIAYGYQMLNDNQILLLIIAKDSNGIVDILINGQYYEAQSCLTNGTSNNGVYEVIFDYNKVSSINLVLQNSFYKYTNYISGIPYQLPVTPDTTSYYFYSPSTLYEFTDFSIGDIKSIKFLYNDIDTTGESYWNTMYLELNDNSLSKGNPVQVGFYFSNTRIESIYYLYWDSVKLQYRGDFKMPANLLIGSIEYYLSMPTKFITSTSLSSIYQLNVYSKDADLMGPVFTTFKKIESMLTVNGVRFGWSFTIQDKVNGFKNGYIVIRGEIDKSIYNITLSPTSPSFKSGDIYEGLYQISIVESIVGINQSFIVTDVLLQDLQGQITQFKLNSLDAVSYPQLNPFIYMNIQDTNTFRINVKRTLIAPSPSYLLKFESIEITPLEPPPSSLEFKSYNITFMISDETGLKETQLPYIYLTSYSIDTLVFSTIIIKSNKTHTSYSSIVNTTNKWGCPSNLQINIYGLVNNYGNYGGYSSSVLLSGGFTNSIPCYSITNLIKLKSVNYSNGKFNIYGIGLNNIKTINIGNDIMDVTSNGKSTVMEIYYDLDSSIKTNNTVDINIYGTTAQNMNTNSIIFSYTKKQFKVPPVNPLLPPVNPPQQCLGNPQCGGSKQGYCTSNGCVCISPYVGNDCSSKVITIQPPDIDTNKPNTTIQVPVDEIDNSNIQSIITVLGLREVDLLTNQEIIYHPLNSWLYSKQQDSNISLYQSSITQNGIKTNVNVSLEWFTDQKSIIFANQNLTMMPSSMKYTVSLSQYAFTNNFCSLQVINSEIFNIISN